ncbi:MAG: 16S rRNA processing protein RimM [Clostridiales bacterium]|nr:16S rRNA processing protein RimM [Clostridiales bacterium]
MKDNLIQAGVITKAHGLRGEVRINPWANSPAFLLSFDRFFIDGRQYEVVSSRVHKNIVIVALAGVNTVEEAEKLRDKVIWIDRDDVELEEGEHFIVDLIGLDAVDEETGERLGKIADVMTLAPHDVYVIQGAREILVPAVPEFVREIDIEGGKIVFRLIEGM